MFAETVRYLISFHYFRNTDPVEYLARCPVQMRLIGDSGAYSAVTQGADISLEEYAEWLALWGPHLDWYANLDVIGDPVASWENQKRLQDEFGLTPVPVFHGGEPWKWLTHYCSLYPFIALGGTAPGLHGASVQEVLRWTVRCFQMGRDHETRFHGFGQTRDTVLRTFPWYSCDSSSWLGTVTYGFFQVWDRNRHRWVRGSLFNRDEVYAAREIIRGYGFDPAFLVDRDLYTRRELVQLSYVSWMAYVHFIRSRHGVQPHPETLEEDGFVLWLVPGAKEPENVGDLIRDRDVASLIR